MKFLKKPSLLLLVACMAFIGCSDDDDSSDTPMETPPATTADFTVTIENVVTPKPLYESGVFNTPVGSTAPGPILPGDAYEFTINAGPVVTPNDGGTRLSFVTMFVQSNDLFLAPDGNGIALYNNGQPIGQNTPEDVTSQILLWDAGTEVNEPTGGPNQKPQQTADDQGMDENGTVTRIMNNTDAANNVLPDVDDVIRVTIQNTGSASFTVRIENVSNATTIATSASMTGRAAVPMSPGVFAVHTQADPFFVEGQAASGAGSIASTRGIEDVAEDGVVSNLGPDALVETGFVIPLSPGAYAVHSTGNPLFTLDAPDYGQGLEGVSEDGVPTDLAASLAANTNVRLSAAFDTPTDASSPGPLTPGKKYSFSFSASQGDKLSLATMFVQSNDWFYSFGESGLDLFNSNGAVTGDVTSSLDLYDNGTEADEVPGAGLNQVIRQAALNAGAADPVDNVRLVTQGGKVPDNSEVIKITITAQ